MRCDFQSVANRLHAAPARSHRRESGEMVDEIVSLRVPADVLVVDAAQFRQRAAVPRTLYHAALHDGKWLDGSH